VDSGCASADRAVLAKPIGTARSLFNRVRKLLDITIRLTALFCLLSAFSFAESWSGALVDSKCYAAEERNVNPTDTLTNVDRDGNLEIRYCSPKPKTKSFAVVQADGTILSLDSAGNAKAAELVRTAGKRSLFFVALTGDRSSGTIRVDSIAVAR
jgi:hypothetical protein